MKTQIIQLNKNDDYISVRDKMGWSQAGRILLVWPTVNQSIDIHLSLTLIKRHASKLGVQLALVTSDNDICIAAEQVGIQAYPDQQAALGVPWQNIKRTDIKLNRLENRAKLESLQKLSLLQPHTRILPASLRITSFVISVVALLILGIFILPGAKIFIQTEKEIQSVTVNISTHPPIIDTNPSSSSLPTTLQEIIVEGRDEIKTSGQILIPDQFASGVLQFTNRSDQTVILPPGFIFSTQASEPVRFITILDDEIAIEAGKIILLEVKAVVPGTSGNLPPDSLVAYEAMPGLDITVTNPAPTMGGTDTFVPAPTSEDRTKLRQKLEEKLGQTAISELQSNLSQDDTLIASSLKLIEIINETSVPEVGQPGEKLSLTLRLRFQLQVLKAEELFKLVDPLMDNSVNAGFTPVDNTLVLRRVFSPTIDEKGNAHWIINAQRELIPGIPAGEIVALIHGSTLRKASERLASSIPVIDEFRINMSPSWWPFLPLVTTRIQVIRAETR